MKYLSNYNLKNKRVLVLGGSGTIGKEVCLALKEHKAHITNLDLKDDIILKRNKINFTKYRLDMSKKSINFFKKIVKNKTPEIFINCSYPHSKGWSNMKFKDPNISKIKKNIDLQLTFTIWSTQFIADQMKRKKIKGKILLLGSIYGVIPQDENLYKNSNIKINSIYSSIKGGLINLTKQLAVYYGRYSIRANIISPGGLKGKIISSNAQQKPSFIKKYTQTVPLNRMAKAEDVASAAIFLVSDASDYITGTNLILDGGKTLI